MARRMRGGGGDHGGGGGGGGHGGASGRWLVSYADFITLMFVVFVVLYAFANIDKNKYGQLANSLRIALGPAGPDIGPIASRGVAGTPMPVLPPERPGNLPDIPDWPAHLVGPPPEEPETAQAPPDQPPPPTAKPSTNPSDPVTTQPAGPVQTPPDEYAQLEQALKTLPGFRSGLLAVSLEQSGLSLSIAGNVLFDPGHTELRESAKQLLAEIVPKLQEVELPIWVYGTADEHPVAGAPSPEYLAAVRSATVITFFREAGLNAKEFVNISTTGTGQSNYRVTIVVQRKK
jgi:chemotaxis protein MotB